VKTLQMTLLALQACGAHLVLLLPRRHGRAKEAWRAQGWGTGAWLVLAPSLYPLFCTPSCRTCHAFSGSEAWRLTGLAFTFLYILPRLHDTLCLLQQATPRRSPAIICYSLLAWLGQDGRGYPELRRMQRATAMETACAGRAAALVSGWRLAGCGTVAWCGLLAAYSIMGGQRPVACVLRCGGKNELRLSACHFGAPSSYHRFARNLWLLSCAFCSSASLPPYRSELSRAGTPLVTLSLLCLAERRYLLLPCRAFLRALPKPAAALPVPANISLFNITGRRYAGGRGWRRSLFC